MHTKAYGGKTRIVPMSLSQFITFITVARDMRFSNPKTLKSYLDILIQKNLSVEDESVWYQQIDDEIYTWVGNR